MNQADQGLDLWEMFVNLATTTQIPNFKRFLDDQTYALLLSGWPKSFHKLPKLQEWANILCRCYKVWENWIHNLQAKVWLSGPWLPRWLGWIVWKHVIRFRCCTSRQPWCPINRGDTAKWKFVLTGAWTGLKFSYPPRLGRGMRSICMTLKITGLGRHYP
jgi:hypothetical protein